MTLDVILQLQEARLRQSLVSAAPTRIACLAESSSPRPRRADKMVVVRMPRGRRPSTLTDPSMTLPEKRRIWSARVYAKRNAAREARD